MSVIAARGVWQSHAKYFAITLLLGSLAAKSVGCHPRCACSHSDVWGIQVGETRELSRFGLMTPVCAA